MNKNLRKTIGKYFPAAYDIHTILNLYRHGRDRKYLCSCCNKEGRFRIIGYPPRLNAMCPSCGAAERHRLIVNYIDRYPDQFSAKSILHFAPEAIMRRKLEGLASKYTGGDLDPAPGDMKLNIEKLDIADSTFDVILCSHVLEHVDDRKALDELFRVLRPGGLALLLFPIIEGWSTTYENPDVKTPEERIVHFGQYDHVRYFGADVRERIKAAGFTLDEYTAVEPDVSRYGLLRGEKIFLARKPAQGLDPSEKHKP